MKYTLLIVDDEYQIREGSAIYIRDVFPQLDVCTAENGLEALDVIHNRHIDAILLDITMRKMDGLTLLECLSKENFFIPTVIISGYSEFQFAQRAMSFGVKKYLVKPFTPKVIKQTVEELLEEIRETREKNTGLELLRRHIRQNGRNLQDELFWQWVSENLEEDFFRTQCVDYGLQLDKKCYQAAILTGGGQDFERKSALAAKFEQSIRFADIPDAIVFKTPEGITVIFGQDEIDPNRQTPFLRQFLESIHDPALTIGLGSSCTGIRGIIESHRLAVFACRNRIVCGGGSVLCSWMLPQQESIGIVFDAAVFTLTLAVCNRQRAIKYIHNAFDLLRQRSLIQPSDIESLSIMIYSSCVNAFGNYGTMQSFNSFISRLSFSEDITQLEICLTDLVIDWIDSAEQKGIFGTPLSLRKLRNYIAENYDKDLTVQFLSDQFDANPDYLGKVFKKEFGETISECLNDARIKGAVDLLLHTDKSVQEIAFQVGFYDQTYFSTVFKKIMGIAPSQFRAIQTARSIRPGPA